MREPTASASPGFAGGGPTEEEEEEEDEEEEEEEERKGPKGKSRISRQGEENT